MKKDSRSRRVLFVYSFTLSNVVLSSFRGEEPLRLSQRPLRSAQGDIFEMICRNIMWKVVVQLADSQSVEGR